MSDLSTQRDSRFMQVIAAVTLANAAILILLFILSPHLSNAQILELIPVLALVAQALLAAAALFTRYNPCKVIQGAFVASVLFALLTFVSSSFALSAEAQAQVWAELRARFPLEEVQALQQAELHASAYNTLIIFTGVWPLMANFLRPKPAKEMASEEELAEPNAKG